MPLIATERFLRSIGLPVEPRVADEHRIIYDLLLQGAIDAAVSTLINHLQADARRSITHLKTVAVIVDPPRLATYLTRQIDLP